jgi:hypothetical protein
LPLTLPEGLFVLAISQRQRAKGTSLAKLGDGGAAAVQLGSSSIGPVGLGGRTPEDDGGSQKHRSGEAAHAGRR